MSLGEDLKGMVEARSSCWRRDLSCLVLMQDLGGTVLHRSRSINAASSAKVLEDNKALDALGTGTALL